MKKTCDHAGGAPYTVGRVGEHLEELMGIPVILVNSVEKKTCNKCGEVISTTIPDLNGLIAAVALSRIIDPLKLTAQEIRFLRKAMNLTGRELAKKMEVSAESISRWENGKEILGPTNEKILRLFVAMAVCDEAPAVDFEPKDIVEMRIEAARPSGNMPPMEFERVRFKRPKCPMEDQWDTHPKKAA